MTTQTQTPDVLNRVLTDTEHQQWESEGYLLLRGLLPASVIEDCRRVFARVSERMLAELKAMKLIESTRPELPLETRFAVAAGKHANRFGRGWRKGIADPEIFEAHATPALVDVIAQLTGTDVVAHPIFNGRPKLPGQQLTVVPWHQDSAYFGPESAKDQIITVWFPLVPVDESLGCMQVIPGSHRHGLTPHVTETREGQFLEAPADAVDERQAVSCPMNPGDVLLFDNLMMHRSLSSTASTIRWSLDFRYLRDVPLHVAPGWHDPNFKWVIRSQTQPITTWPQWREQVNHWEW